MQLVDPVCAEAQARAEDFMVVLSERRRRAANLPWRAAILERRTGILVGAGDRVRDFDEEAAMLEMLGVQQIAHGRDGRERDAARLRFFIEIEHGLLLYPIFKKYFKRVPVGGALEPVGEN